MGAKPQITDRRVVASTRMFRIERLLLRFGNGNLRSYERLTGETTDSVLIVPMRDHSTVLLVREYAAGVDRYELGPPKGRIEAGEDLLQAANREIMEEIGFAARRLRLLRALTLAPAYIQHRTHVVLAEDLYPRRAPGDEPEDIEVVPWRLDDLEGLLQRDDCTEARTIAALYLAARTLSGTARPSPPA